MAFSPQGVEGDEAIAAAVQSPERFVLKPQREGGGMCKFICIFSKKNTNIKNFETYIDQIPHCRSYTIIVYYLLSVTISATVFMKKSKFLLNLNIKIKFK